MPFLAATISILPFLACLPQFRQLFWFGDEWDLLHQIERRGLAGWVTSLAAEGIGENFIPLFKLIWGGAVFFFSGSYFAIIALLWLFHALNVLALGLILRRSGSGAAAVLFACLFAGLPASNIEALGWSIQFSQVSSFTFLLWGLLAVLHYLDAERQRIGWAAAVLILTTCGLLTFSRGVLAAVALSGALLVMAKGLNVSLRARIALAVPVLLLALAEASLITGTSQGNHQHLLSSGAETYRSMARFAIGFFLFNPFHALLRITNLGTLAMVCLGVCKVAVVAVALATTSGRIRMLILLFVAFDGANACLVAIGRYQTGLAAAVGSRYQYVSLFCLAPSVAAVFACFLTRIPRRQTNWVAGAALLACATGTSAKWRSDMIFWADWRGRNTRLLLVSSAAQGAMPNVPSITVAGAREMVRAYHLH